MYPPKTNSQFAPENGPLPQKGKECLPFAPIFRGRVVSFREATCLSFEHERC